MVCNMYGILDAISYGIIEIARLKYVLLKVKPILHTNT